MGYKSKFKFNIVKTVVVEMNINLEEWSLGDVAGLAVHSSGLMVRIHGSVTNPHEVKTINVPEGLHFHDQARLLRAGMDFLAKNTKNIPLSRRIKSSPELAKREKTPEEIEEAQRAYSERSHSNNSYFNNSYANNSYSNNSYSNNYSNNSNSNHSHSNRSYSDSNRSYSSQRSYTDNSYSQKSYGERSYSSDRSYAENAYSQKPQVDIIYADKSYSDKSDRPQRSVLSLKKNS
jgi:hypothetical protein